VTRVGEVSNGQLNAVAPSPLSYIFGLSKIVFLAKCLEKLTEFLDLLATTIKYVDIIYRVISY